MGKKNVVCIKKWPSSVQSRDGGGPLEADGGGGAMIINVPVVYMMRDVMILMQANQLQGPLEGVGPENQDFFGP
jgi:hypothetical protein